MENCPVQIGDKIKLKVDHKNVSLVFKFCNYVWINFELFSAFVVNSTNIKSLPSIFIIRFKKTFAFLNRYLYILANIVKMFSRIFSKF